MVYDADSSYTCNDIPYLGNGTVELPRGTTHGECFALELSKPYKRNGRTVTTDNCFSSFPLALDLRKRGMEFLGTIRQKPYVPKELMSMKLKKGKSVTVYNYDKNDTSLSHQDSNNKQVQLFSTIHHQPTIVEKVKKDVQMFYNATKGSVDTFNRLYSSATCRRKTR